MADNEIKSCENHSGICVNIANLTRDVSMLKDDLENLKSHTSTRLDEVNRLYHNINDKMTRLEIIMTEKFRNIEEAIISKKNNTLLLVGQFVYPLLVALILYLTINK